MIVIMTQIIVINKQCKHFVKTPPGGVFNLNYSTQL
jgi:hypothetical protein